MLQRVFRSALAVSAVALSGCGGATPATDSVICVTAPAPPMLIYPSDGAAGVPDGNFTLVVSGGSQSIDLAIGTVVALTNLAPTGSVQVQTPPGNAYGYTVPALQPLTTYSVRASVARSGCYDANKVSSTQWASIGSFTTK